MSNLLNDIKSSLSHLREIKNIEVVDNGAGVLIEFKLQARVGDELVLSPGKGGASSWTHCKRGHEFTQANTLLRNCGRRMCRACARERTRK